MCMDKGLLTEAMFGDLKTAFDTVDHARLLSKLAGYATSLTATILLYLTVLSLKLNRLRVVSRRAQFQAHAYLVY